MPKEEQILGWGEKIMSWVLVMEFEVFLLYAGCERFHMQFETEVWELIACWSRKGALEPSV